MLANTRFDYNSDSGGAVTWINLLSLTGRYYGPTAC
jgi:hypothetical protein